MNKGAQHRDLLPTYRFIICDFIAIPELPHRSHTTFKILEEIDRVELNNHFRMHFLELPKIQERVPLSLKDAWGLFLKNPNNDFQQVLIVMDEALKIA